MTARIIRDRESRIGTLAALGPPPGSPARPVAPQFGANDGAVALAVDGSEMFARLDGKPGLAMADLQALLIPATRTPPASIDGARICGAGTHAIVKYMPPSPTCRGSSRRNTCDLPQYAAHMSMAFARAASIAGHPLPVLSLTLLALAFLHGADQATLVRIGIWLALFAAVLLGYSWWRVRAGHWRHVDASHAGERRQLNGVLLGLILSGAALAAVSSSMTLALQLALAALPIVLALLTTRWCKLSLHLAFVVYASALLFPVSTTAAIALLLFAAVLAWSRLRLARHTPRDLVAGAVAGALAGLSAWAIPQLPAWQG